MSRWSKIKENKELFAQLVNFYQTMFPIEVRYFLCQWFEEKPWNTLDSENPAMENTAKELLKEMLAHIRAKSQDMDGDLELTKFHLSSACQQFESMYMNDPLGFLKIIRTCMDKEQDLLCLLDSFPQENSEEVTTEMNESELQRANTNQQIVRQLQQLEQKTQEAERQYKEMHHKQEFFIIQYQENLKIGAQLQQLQINMQELRLQAQNTSVGADQTKLSGQLKERASEENSLQGEKKRVEIELSQQGQLLLSQRIELADMYNEIITELQLLQRKVLDEELIAWKRRQQLGGNGEVPQKSELDMLQHWCEFLAELIWNVRQQIRRMTILRAQLPINFPEGTKDLLPELSDVITGMLSSLVTSTFIVEQQPPQVLKKDARFSATIRLLVGGKLNIQMSAPQVKATIISENQAKNLLRSDMKAKSQTSGEILNNTGTMDFQTGPPPSSGSLSITFRNMQLKKIQRSDKKGSEAVTEEKFCILFQSDFNVGGNDLVFQVWTLSLPVVVTVHGNQECNAMATVLWDNAFSAPGREPFLVPDIVPWPELGEQLNMKFLHSTGRGLTPQNLDYLASKMFGPLQDYSQSMASWMQFNKETMKDRNFTFWEWFYAVLKLTKEHLKGPWNDGSIIGFISKTKAQECLNTKDIGNFLLRFSDSECGGITIAWIAESQTSLGEREVWNLAPYLTRDFAIRGLADRIHDLKNLVTLYPDTPKDVAFSKYYITHQDQEHPKRNGYVPTHLVNVMVPPQPGGPMCDIDPRTPQSNHHTLAALSPVPSQAPGLNLDDAAALPEELMEMELVDLINRTDYNHLDMSVDANAFVHGFGFKNTT